MTTHTIILQDTLYDNLFAVWQHKYFNTTMGYAMKQTILDGIARVRYVSLTRQAIGLHQGVKKPFSLSMSDDVWNLVDQHQKRFNIYSRSEAVRELLRLGLWLPEPIQNGTRGVARPTRLKANRDLIVDMAKRGVAKNYIARTMGISRQRVHYVLREEAGRTA